MSTGGERRRVQKGKETTERGGTQCEGRDVVFVGDEIEVCEEERDSWIARSGPGALAETVGHRLLQNDGGQKDGGKRTGPKQQNWR